MQWTAHARPDERAGLWLAKVGTGVLIFVLLIVHLVVNHLVARGGLLTYADVLAYYSHPLIPIVEGIFLVFVVSHALLGLRGIVLDLAPPARLARAVDVLLTCAGTAAIVYGIWLLYTISSRA